MQIRQAKLTAVLLLAACAASAPAAEYKSEALAFSYPEGWTVVPPEEAEAILRPFREAVPQEANAIEQEVVVREANDAGGARILVMLIRRRTLVNDKMIQTVRQSVSRSWQGTGWKVADESAGRARTADGEAISLGTTVESPDGNRTLREWQVYSPAKERTAWMICLADKSAFEKDQVAFTQAVSSLHVEPEPGSLRKLASKGLVPLGMIVLAWVFLRNARKRRKAMRESGETT